MRRSSCVRAPKRLHVCPEVVVEHESWQKESGVESQRIICTKRNRRGLVERIGAGLSNPSSGFRTGLFNPFHLASRGLLEDWLHCELLRRKNSFLESSEIIDNSSVPTSISGGLSALSC